MTPDQRMHLEDLIEAYAAVSVDEALDAPRSMVERSKAEIFEEIGALLDDVEQHRVLDPEELAAPHKKQAKTTWGSMYDV